MKWLLSRAALLLLALVVATAGRAAGTLAAPAKTQYASQHDALMAASLLATSIGGNLVLTSGTRSMEPLIHGKTYVVVAKHPYQAIAKQDILLYRGRPDAAKADRKTILHRAVLQDKYGWMMSGDNNRFSESWDRVTADNYLGTVVAIFAFPQA